MRINIVESNWDYFLHFNSRWQHLPISAFVSLCVRGLDDQNSFRLNNVFSRNYRRLSEFKRNSPLSLCRVAITKFSCRPCDSDGLFSVVVRPDLRYLQISFIYRNVFRFSCVLNFFLCQSLAFCFQINQFSLSYPGPGLGWILLFSQEAEVQKNYAFSKEEKMHRFCDPELLVS